MIGSITTFVLSSMISQNLSLSALDGLSLEFFISLKLMIESVFLNAGKIYFLLNGLINASAKRKYNSVTRYYHII